MLLAVLRSVLSLDQGAQHPGDLLLARRGNVEFAARISANPLLTCDLRSARSSRIALRTRLLRHLGIRNAALATPYLTDSSSDTAAQPPVPVVRGTLTATLPARSLVTFAIR